MSVDSDKNINNLKQLSFNQNSTCFTVATPKNFSIYSTDDFKVTELP